MPARTSPGASPRLFLHAAAQMGATAETSVVIEDSRSGILAAVAAGMRAIGYAAGEPDRAAALAAVGATHTVDKLADVPALLGLTD